MRLCICGAEVTSRKSTAKYCSRPCFYQGQRKLASVAPNFRSTGRTDEYREAFARYQRARRYGLTLEALDQIIADHPGCAVCARGDVPLVIDHDHSTGVVRGMLCNSCNRVIGLMQDDAEMLERAAAYLRSRESVVTGDTKAL